MSSLVKEYFLRIVSFFLIYLLVIFQISFLNQASFFTTTINLLTLLSCSLYLVFGARFALATAFWSGLVYDGLTMGRLGRTSVFLLLILLGFSLVKRFFAHSTTLHFFYFYVVTIFFRLASPATAWGWPLLGHGLFDLLLLFLLSSFLRWLRAVFNPTAFIQLRFKDLR